MHKHGTRSNKSIPIVNHSTQELGKLERANIKAHREVEMSNPIVLIRDEAGILHDLEGHALNAQGQKFDTDGNAIIKVAVGEHQHQADGVARHQPDNNGLHGNDGADAIDRMRTRNDFELKPAYYTLVGLHPFDGLSSENPIDHIERFEDLATSIKANGVSSDYLFCKLFPYSLAGEATYWLKQLKPGSLTTWEATKTAFLNNFYDDTRSEDFQMKISTFTQGPTEAFKAA
ncbi:hypothetical protein V5N11_035189 [Cardamine amara subsp. amara]|uniref:Retrotransposon gag domain-containing protein n=1 Tax=Cardamine amara subsp. amara TaxID=228776 RepID=A0ABD0ZHR5_CARAN